METLLENRFDASNKDYREDSDGKHMDQLSGLAVVIEKIRTPFYP